MPAYGPLQRNVYNCEDVEHYDYNPEKSKEILEAAGCEWGMTDSTTATAKSWFCYQRKRWRPGTY